jgi:hypothetical protein
MAWGGDNTGPPTAEEVLDIFKRVRASFPQAELTAAGFDGFVKDLAAAAPSLDLPVVTAEIGDTWIHGAASDPAKLSGAPPAGIAVLASSKLLWLALEGLQGYAACQICHGLIWPRPFDWPACLQSTARCCACGGQAGSGTMTMLSSALAACCSR